MKWKFIALLALSGIFLFSACKKDNSTPGDNTSNLPKAIVEEAMSMWLGHVKDSSLLSYDGENRLTSIVSVTTPGFKFTYQYNPDNTVVMNLFENGQVAIYNKIWIGDNHYADSSYQYNNETDTTGSKYIYNASNQLIEEREYVYSHLVNPYPYLDDDYVYSYDNNGNLTREENYSSVTTYDYYNQANPLSLNTFVGFIPAAKNLIKTETVTSGGTASVITHTYKVDDKNRLIEDAAVGDDGSSDIKRYYY